MNLMDLGMGVKFIKSGSHKDHRGEFIEAFDLRMLKEMIGFSPIASNISMSLPSVLRGLHMQVPNQAKLVRCLSGHIVDVWVDARPDSPTFGKHGSINLYSLDRSLYIPPGFLHGFYCKGLSTIEYLVDKPYNADRQITVQWDDPDLAINWGKIYPPIISSKDLNGQLFRNTDFAESRPVDETIDT